MKTVNKEEKKKTVYEEEKKIGAKDTFHTALDEEIKIDQGKMIFDEGD
jgi:hypothetical protein